MPGRKLFYWPYKTQKMLPSTVVHNYLLLSLWVSNGKMKRDALLSNLVNNISNSVNNMSIGQTMWVISKQSSKIGSHDITFITQSPMFIKRLISVKSKALLYLSNFTLSTQQNLLALKICSDSEWGCTYSSHFFCYIETTIQLSSYLCRLFISIIQLQ